MMAFQWNGELVLVATEHVGWITWWNKTMKLTYRWQQFFFLIVKAIFFTFKEEKIVTTSLLLTINFLRQYYSNISSQEMRTIRQYWALIMHPVHTLCQVMDWQKTFPSIFKPYRICSCIQLSLILLPFVEASLWLIVLWLKL